MNDNSILHRLTHCKYYTTGMVAKYDHGLKKADFRGGKIHNSEMAENKKVRLTYIPADLNYSVVPPGLEPGTT